MTKTIQKPNYAFIDSQNLNLGIKSTGWNLDYAKFRLYLKNKYNVTQAYLFIGHVPGNESLYTYLQKCGYILIFKPTLEIKKKSEVKVKGNVDAELVLHAMIELGNCHKQIIVSGDGDFHCLIEYLANNDKLLRLLTPNSKYSRLLGKFHKYISNLESLRSKLGVKKTKISVRSKP